MREGAVKCDLKFNNYTDSQFRFSLAVYEQPLQAFLRPTPHLGGLPTHGVNEHMGITSDGRWLRTTLPKYPHFIRDGALPYMIHAKAEVQHIGERERGKELAVG